MQNGAFSTDVAVEALKGTPPVAVAASGLVGLLDLNVIVAILTGIYVILQGAYLIWKWRREAREGGHGK